MIHKRALENPIYYYYIFFGERPSKRGQKPRQRWHQRFQHRKVGETWNDSAELRICSQSSLCPYCLKNTQQRLNLYIHSFIETNIPQNHYSIVTLHYITLRHFTRQLHLQWPMVHLQSHSSSPIASLKRWVFKSFSKVSVFVSSWRLEGREFHAIGSDNEKFRLPNFSFNCGSSYRKKLLENLSLSRPGRSAYADLRMSLCPTGTQGCDQLAPGAWARRACR